MTEEDRSQNTGDRRRSANYSSYHQTLSRLDVAVFFLLSSSFCLLYSDFCLLTSVFCPWFSQTICPTTTVSSVKLSKATFLRRLFIATNASCLGDVNPQAPVHVLIISHEHMNRWMKLRAATKQRLDFIACSRALANERGLSESAIACYHTGAGAGQSVFIFICILLGGRPLVGHQVKTLDKQNSIEEK